MATNNLEVKFKVETSDLRKGSSDAKRTVKDSADQMARDVNGAAQNMASSMGKVNAATKSISDAASTASNGVRSLEQNVARSASSMERNLSKVSRQMSAMQMFHMGARGVQMLGGAAANIATLAGASADTVSGINGATGIVTGGIQGASIGKWFGPWGVAIGGLVGAGSGLLEAAIKQKEAAEKQKEVADKTFADWKNSVEGIDKTNKARQYQETIDFISRMPDTLFDYKTAENEVEAARTRLEKAQLQLNGVLDMAYGRNGYRTMLDLPGPVRATMRQMEGLINPFEPEAWPKDYTIGPGQYDLGVVNWFGEGGLLGKLRGRDMSNFEHAWMSLSKELGGNIANTEYRQYGTDKGKDWLEIFPRGIEGADPKFWEYFGFKITKAIQDAQKELDEAQKQYDMMAPLEQRLSRFYADSEARKNAPLNFGEDDWPEYYGGDPTKEPFSFIESVSKEAIAAGAQRLKDLTAMLNGIVGGSGFSSPTDALTRIGGGRGYASYNDSAARVQRNIEANLRTLIKNQTDQNNEILHAIENISFENNQIEWQEEN